jgi:predicted transcriptional regulator
VLWDKCKDHAGIGKDDFFAYYEGCDKGYAIEIKNFIRFDEPLEPND